MSEKNAIHIDSSSVRSHGKQRVVSHSSDLGCSHFPGTRTILFLKTGNDFTPPDLTTPMMPIHLHTPELCLEKQPTSMLYGEMPQDRINFSQASTAPRIR